MIVFENALKVSKSVKNPKKRLTSFDNLQPRSFSRVCFARRISGKHAVALNKIGVHSLAASNCEKKVMKTIDDILCEERQIFLSNPKNTKVFTIENVEMDVVEIAGVLDAQSKAKLYSLLLQNYVHEAEDFTRLLLEVLRKINEMSRSGRFSFKRGFIQCCKRAVTDGT